VLLVQGMLEGVASVRRRRLDENRFHPGAAKLFGSGLAAFARSEDQREAGRRTPAATGGWPAPAPRRFTRREKEDGRRQVEVCRPSPQAEERQYVVAIGRGKTRSR